MRKDWEMIERRGPEEYLWTAACSPALVMNDAAGTIMARRESCKSHTGEYPRAIRGVPARAGRGDGSLDYGPEGVGADERARAGWVDAEVLMEWGRRHLDSSVETMRRFADGS